MTAQQLREKLQDRNDAEEFTTNDVEILIDILCDQCEALEKYKSVCLHDAKLGDPREIYYAREALADTDARLKAMGVL